jgi:hypothetical protein
MSAPLVPMLEHWHDFYVLVGTAAAALVALLFVAASIGAGVLTGRNTAGTRIYMTPVVFHFTSVLFACAVGLVPSHTRGSFGLVIGVGAVAAFVYSCVLSIRVVKDHSTDSEDTFAYGIAPLIGYVAAVGAAGLFFFASPRAPDVLAGALIWLLIVNIRNAWDLALFMAHKHTASK